MVMQRVYGHLAGDKEVRDGGKRDSLLTRCLMDCVVALFVCIVLV